MGGARRRGGGRPGWRVPAPGFLLTAAALACAPALAHPISQGSLEMNVDGREIVVTAHVPIEQVFLVRAVSSARGSAAPPSSSDVFTDHAAYLLAHLRLAAGGRAVAGTLAGVRTPKDGAGETVAYDVRFEASVPADRIVLEQDLLREIEYAPGNPWEATYVVRVQVRGKPVREGLLLTSARPLTIALGEESSTLRAERARMFRDYVRHGLTHILGGYDHLLFIVALVLAAASFWDLVKVIAAFTLAHSVTLTLSVLHVVRLPPAVVEPMIAASIVIVAASNVVAPKQSRGWVRLATAFFFGLFHGLGFAGGLLDAMADMPGSAVGIAIVAFSLGVELGHQGVVLPLFAALRLVRRSSAEKAGPDRLHLAVQRGGSLAVSAAGLFYLIAALAR